MNKYLPLTLGCLLFYFPLLRAQTLNKQFVTTNNAVRAIAQKGDTVFIGGDFTELGLQSRGIAKITPGSTKPDNNFPQLGAGSNVNAMENDGNGGFYLAGNFTNFNGTIINPSSKIIHVLSDGSLDISFTTVDADSDVYCMKLFGGKLYIGGAFTTIQNTNRPFLAALNASTGALDSWLPPTPDNAVEKIDASASKIFILGKNITSIGGYPAFTHFGVIRSADGVYVNNFPVANNVITAFAVNNNLLYLGGNFNQAGPSAQGFAKLSAADASVDPNFPSTNGNVLAVLPDGNGGYYIGGNFTKVGNKNRSNLAHILNDGTVDASFNVSVSDQVLCITNDNNNLYFGGNFTSVNGTTRNYAAAVSKTTGVLTSWNPNPDTAVLTILQSNNTIYLGGWFTNINGTARNYAAAVSTSGSLTNWAPEPNYYVNQIITNNNSTSLFICGGFTTVKAKAHEYIVKTNTTNGAPATWHPLPDNVIKSIALSGNTIYLAGSFSFINGSPRQFIGAVDTSSANPTSFSADLNNFPNCITITAGKLYVAGNYSQIQSKNISYISRVDISTDTVDDWQPVSNAYTALVYSNGTDVIAGGNFTLMNGLEKNFMAAVNLNSNKFTNWNPDGVASFNVNTICKILPVGSNIFVGGDFNYFDGFHTVNNVLIIDSTTGNITNLFTQYPTGTVSQLCIFDNKLMVGGNFSSLYNVNTLTTTSRSNIAAYDQTSDTLSSSVYDANDTLNGMFTDASGNLIISGNFSLLNYVNRNYLAAVSLSSGQVLPWNPAPDNVVKALAIKSTSLFAGGSFHHIGTQTKNFIALINTDTGKPGTWSADCDSTVNAMTIANNILYFGGAFTKVKGSARAHAAAVTTSGSGTLKTWAPNPDSAVNAIAATSNIYLGGNFDKVKNTAHSYIAKVTANGKVASWNPLPDRPILSFAINDSSIFVGGNKFTKIAKKSRNALAAFDTGNNAISTFDAKLKVNNVAPVVNALASNGNILYIGTNALDQLNGVSRGRLAAADITTSTAINFNPLPDSSVLTLSVANNYLLAGGLWNSLGTNVSPSYFAVFSLDAQSKQTPQQIIAGNQIQKNISILRNDAVIYPNPVTNGATINFSYETKAKISLMDASGKTIWIKNDFIGKQLQFDVTNLTSGVYFITIESNGNIEKLKFIKD